MKLQRAVTSSQRVVKTFQVSISPPSEVESLTSEASPTTHTHLFKIIEILPQVHIWPSAMLLSAYLLARSQEFHGKVVLDLGAGCGLTSLAASVTGCKHVYSTERRDEKDLIDNLQDIVALNKREGLIPSDASIEVVPFSWLSHGEVRHSTFQQLFKIGSESQHKHIDIILGSDVFYSGEDIDPILTVVHELALENPSLIFYTSYQQRSTSRSISPFLGKYGMKAQVVESSAFLHPYHLQLQVMQGMCRDDEEQCEEACNDTLQFEDLQDICLIKIYRLDLDG